MIRWFSVAISILCDHNTNLLHVLGYREQLQLAQGLTTLKGWPIVHQSQMRIDNNAGMRSDRDKCLKHFLRSDGIGRSLQNDGSGCIFSSTCLRNFVRIVEEIIRRFDDMLGPQPSVFRV